MTSNTDITASDVLQKASTLMSIAFSELDQAEFDCAVGLYQNIVEQVDILGGAYFSRLENAGLPRTFTDDCYDVLLNDTESMNLREKLSQIQKILVGDNV